MGCSFSQQEKVNQLEKKLVKAVVSAKRRAMHVRKVSLNSLMLHSPKLRLGFQRCRDIYLKLDTQKRGYIEWSEFKNNCATIGIDPTSPIVREIFEAADMDHKNKIDATEFSVVLVILFLLDNDKTVIQDPEIIQAFGVVEKAFMYFDSSADGYLERQEMRVALRSGSVLVTRAGVKKSLFGKKSLADRLFDELDWDKSGRVSFKEFLVGMERIVLQEYGDDEDDEDLLEDEISQHQPNYKMGRLDQDEPEAVPQAK